MEKQSTKCPFCGSTNIQQTNALTNKVMASGLAILGNSFTGLHAKGKHIEDDLFDREFECKSCGKKWKNDGHTLGLEEDEYRIKMSVSKLLNKNVDISSHAEIMKFCWEMDAYIYNIRTFSEYTGVDWNTIDFYPSNECKARFHFLKAFSILLYVTSDNEKEFSKAMDCSAGMRECVLADQYLSFNENKKCHAILTYIYLNILYNLGYEKKQELYNECLLSVNEDFLFSHFLWVKIIEYVNKQF